MNLIGKGQQFFTQAAQGLGVDPFAPLNGIDYVILDQEEHWWDLVPICNSESKFSIYPTNNNLAFEKYPKPPPYIGTFSESSHYCARQIMRSCREFKGTIRLGSFVAAQVMAPLKCHCPMPCMTCPCDRPICYVSDTSEKLIGTIKMPGFGPLCCQIGNNDCPLLELEIQDNQGNLRWRIKSEFCQKSVVCCPFKCCGCETVDYIIYDQYSNPTGAFIKNQLNECMTEVCTSADKYAVSFPPNCFPQDKIMIIQAALWIDYLQFRA